jgi:hypothetical protein
MLVSMSFLFYARGVTPVEGLYCKRPIQCLACTPRLRSGGGPIRWAERGWGVNSSEDARHCSVLYICKYFVVTPPRRKGSFCQEFKCSNKIPLYLPYMQGCGGLHDPLQHFDSAYDQQARHGGLALN